MELFTTILDSIIAIPALVLLVERVVAFLKNQLLAFRRRNPYFTELTFLKKLFGFDLSNGQIFNADLLYIKK